MTWNCAKYSYIVRLVNWVQKITSVELRVVCPYRQLENQAPKTTGGNQLYNTLELLMMGIMVPETCWASNEIHNKKHLLHLVGILFPQLYNFVTCNLCTQSWSEAKVIAELQSNDGMKSSVPLTRWEVQSGTGEDSCPLGYNTMYIGNCVLDGLAASSSLSV
jgi:hypothetical protein